MPNDSPPPPPRRGVPRIVFFMPVWFLMCWAGAYFLVPGAAHWLMPGIPVDEPSRILGAWSLGTFVGMAGGALMIGTALHRRGRREAEQSQR